MTRFLLDLDIDNQYFEYPKYIIPVVLGLGLYYNRYSLVNIANYAADLYLDIKYAVFPKKYINKTSNESGNSNWTLTDTIEGFESTCYKYLYNCQNYYITVPHGTVSPYIPTFPLYNDSEIETSLLPEYNNVSLVYYNYETKTQETICEIADIWNQLAGPKQDFYYDFNLPVCLKHLLPLIIKQSNITSTVPIDNLSVTYTDMFDNQQIIKYNDCLLDLKQTF